MSSRHMTLPPEDLLRLSSDDGSHYLHPGKLVVSRDGAVITTILGSCVAVCLYDVVAGVGGMNHYLLPRWNAIEEGSIRYGNVAIEKLIDAVVRGGALRLHLRAKIFGGAAVMPQFVQVDRQNLGSQNVEVAINALKAAAIPIVANDTGGRRGRKLIFNTADGTAMVKQL